MSERSRASTPSPWRRPGPAAPRPAADFFPPPGAAAEASPPDGGTPEPEPEERTRRRSRRLLRWVAVIVGIILAVLACWQDPLYAV